MKCPPTSKDKTATHGKKNSRVLRRVPKYLRTANKQLTSIYTRIPIYNSNPCHIPTFSSSRNQQLIIVLYIKNKQKNRESVVLISLSYIYCKKKIH